MAETAREIGSRQPGAKGCEKRSSKNKWTSSTALFTGVLKMGRFVIQLSNLRADHDVRRDERSGVRRLVETTVATKVKGSAAGQYLGFALQPVRMFYHLLTCPAEASVGLEHVDDVSVHQGKNILVAEQCKSYLTGNPISNWSTVFWKTLANWVENVEAGIFDIETTRFQLYVVPNKTPGFAAHLSAVTTGAEISAALEDIRKKHKKLKNAPECEKYLAKIIDGNPKTVQGVIRKRCVEALRLSA